MTIEEVYEENEIESDFEDECPKGCECNICFDNSFVNGYW